MLSCRLYSSINTCHMLCVTCCLSPVTGHMWLTSTATATDPILAITLVLHITEELHYCITTVLQLTAVMQSSAVVHYCKWLQYCSNAVLQYIGIQTSSPVLNPWWKVSYPLGENQKSEYPWVFDSFRVYTEICYISIIASVSVGCWIPVLAVLNHVTQLQNCDVWEQ